MFSILMPMDANRLAQFLHTKQAYDAMPEKKEFIIPTRSIYAIRPFLEEHDLMRDVRLVAYKHDKGFNPSMALNIGARNAKYENLIITSPEVKPNPDTLERLSRKLDTNVICQVSDQDEHGNLETLVSKTFRGETPAMYFLAMFKKSDIEKINGWDEDFMKGYAYEDNDFGERWVRAGLPFEVDEDIQGIHQYHPRSETIPNGSAINLQHYYDNTDNNVIYCSNGLKQP